MCRVPGCRPGVVLRRAIWAVCDIERLDSHAAGRTAASYTVHLGMTLDGSLRYWNGHDCPHMPGAEGLRLSSRPLRLDQP